MIAAMMVAAYRFLPCTSAAVGLVLLVFPTPLNAFCWFPGGLGCVSGQCAIRGIFLGLTAQRICSGMALPVG